MIGGAARRLTPALIVPDEQTWTMLGEDPAGMGAQPSFEAAASAGVILPGRIPEQLGEPLLRLLAGSPNRLEVHRGELAVPGSLETAELLRRAWAGVDELDDGNTHGDHGHGDHAHGDHAHGDMMAIVGEPSPDLLVMERIELRYGPLAIPFPGGLTVDATLDGDVVVNTVVSGLGEQPVPADAPAPDPLSPAAWAAALARGGETGFRDGRPELVAVEIERATSHLAWLRAFSRLLGWARMTQFAGTALRELSGLRAAGPGPGASADSAADLDAAETAIIRLIELVAGSRALRWRLAGRGVVGSDEAERLALDGPNARASGLKCDERLEDPRYSALGFESLVELDGDAAARTLLRAREARQSVELARTAPALEGGDPALLSTGSVEGPRGALRARRRGDGAWTFEAPGAAGALTVAAEAMVGESWGDALAILASFDLSPWAFPKGEE